MVTFFLWLIPDQTLAGIGRSPAEAKASAEVWLDDIDFTEFKDPDWVRRENRESLENGVAILVNAELADMKNFLYACDADHLWDMWNELPELLP